MSETLASRVLVVDDDRAISLHLAESLSNEGFDVSVASDAGEALAVAANTAFDLAVLDIELPGMSGVELGKRLLREHNLPYIMLTSSQDLELVEETSKQGCLAFLHKPIDTLALISAVKTSLEVGHSTRKMTSALTRTRETERALGYLMGSLALPYQEANQRLKEYARSQKMNMHEAACALLEEVDARLATIAAIRRQEQAIADERLPGGEQSIIRALRRRGDLF